MLDAAKFADLVLLLVRAHAHTHTHTFTQTPRGGKPQRGSLGGSDSRGTTNVHAAWPGRSQGRCMQPRPEWWSGDGLGTTEPRPSVMDGAGDADGACRWTGRLVLRWRPLSSSTCSRCGAMRVSHAHAVRRARPFPRSASSRRVCVDRVLVWAWVAVAWGAGARLPQGDGRADAPGRVPGPDAAQKDQEEAQGGWVGGVRRGGAPAPHSKEGWRRRKRGVRSWQCGGGAGGRVATARAAACRQQLRRGRLRRLANQHAPRGPVWCVCAR